MGSPVAIEVDWESITAEGEALRSLLVMIEDTAAAVTAVVEEFGPQELAASVKGIRFVPGAQPSVMRRNDRLVVTADFACGKQGRLDQTEIKKAVAAAL